MINLSDTDGQVVTLYAQWEPEPYYISFEPNGASGAMSNQKLFHDIDSTLPGPGDMLFQFEYENHQFTGWNTAYDGSGTAYALGDTVINLTDEKDGTVQLFAQWEPETYVVEFNSNSPDATGVMLPQQMNRGMAVELNDQGFSRYLYRFESWNTSPDGSGDRYEDHEAVENLADTGGTITLYAQWESAYYGIEFDPNNGEGTMPNQQFMKDEELELSQCAFWRDGYTFAGWNTLPDGKGTSYSDMEKVKNLANVNDTLILYAKWDENGGETPTPQPSPPGGETPTPQPSPPGGETPAPKPSPSGDKQPETGDSSRLPQNLALLFLVVSGTAAVITFCVKIKKFGKN